MQGLGLPVNHIGKLSLTSQGPGSLLLTLVQGKSFGDAK